MEDEINHLRRSNSVRDILRKMKETDVPGNLSPSMKVDFAGSSTSRLSQPKFSEEVYWIQSTLMLKSNQVSQCLNHDDEKPTAAKRNNCRVKPLSWTMSCSKRKRASLKFIRQSTSDRLDLKKVNIRNNRLQDTVTRYNLLLAEIQGALIADIKEKEATIHSIQAVCNKFEMIL